MKRTATSAAGAQCLHTIEVMSFRLQLTTVLAIGAVLSGHAAQSTPPAQAPAQDSPVFSSRSDLVVLDALVTSRKGQYVAGLDASAFIVQEDGVRQTVQFFAEHDSPATVGLIVDSSGSMWTAADSVMTAVGTFVETSNPQDEVFALAFNDDVHAVLPASAPFTGDARTMRGALAAAFEPWGRTCLYDALVAGFDYLSRGTRQRKALVVVSDGGDNASRATLEQVERMARGSNTVIYAVGLKDPLEHENTSMILKRLAESSGGTAFRPNHTGQIERVMRAIAQDIRNSYTLGYVSTNAVRDGRLRRIRVTASRPSQSDLQVRTRTSYVAGP